MNYVSQLWILLFGQCTMKLLEYKGWTLDQWGIEPRNKNNLCQGLHNGKSTALSMENTGQTEYAHGKNKAYNNLSLHRLKKINWNDIEGLSVAYGNHKIPRRKQRGKFQCWISQLFVAYVTKSFGTKSKIDKYDSFTVTAFCAWNKSTKYNGSLKYMRKYFEVIYWEKRLKNSISKSNNWTIAIQTNKCHNLTKAGWRTKTALQKIFKWPTSNKKINITDHKMIAIMSYHHMHIRMVTVRM